MLEEWLGITNDTAIFDEKKKIDEGIPESRLGTGQETVLRRIMNIKKLKTNWFDA